MLGSTGHYISLYNYQLFINLKNQIFLVILLLLQWVITTIYCVHAYVADCFLSFISYLNHYRCHFTNEETSEEGLN